MYLEAEVFGLVCWAFLAVEGVTVLILLGLFLRSRNRALLWFGGQALWLGAAYFFFFRCLNQRPVPGFSMYTEEQSLLLALAGVCWALSMVCMLLGVYRLLRKGAVLYQF